MKKLALALPAALVLLLAVVLVRAARFGVAQGPAAAAYTGQSSRGMVGVPLLLCLSAALRENVVQEPRK